MITELAAARLNGRWRLVRRLGEGAEATAWEAVDERDGARVALKSLHLLAGSDARERFGLEFRALAGMSHPHLLAVYDLDVAREGGPLAAGQPFFTAELAGGAPPLETLPRLAAPARARALCQLLADVASALEALHVRGLVHHDVKPQNLLYDASGRSRLADLGLAAARGATGAPRGTPAYLAPEALVGAGDEPRVDLYALGATAFELWSGRPLRAGSLADVLAAAGAPPPPLSGDDAPPTGLAELIGRLLDPDPRRRPSSARVVLDEAVRLGARLDGALVPPASRVVAQPLLCGRDRELDRALAALEPDGGVRVLCVAGPPGSGRTRFVEELKRAAQLRAVGAGRTPRSWHGPSLEAALRTLAPGGVDDPASRLSVLCGLLARAPQVLHLELDGASPLAHELVAMAAHGAVLPSVVVVEPLLGSEPAGESIALGPLGRGDVAALCESMVGEVEPAFAAAVHRASGGLPSRAVAIVRGAAARARPGAPLAAADVAALEGEDLESLVGAAVVALPEGTRKAVEALAVLGRAAMPAEVAPLAGAAPEVVFAELRAAAAAGVVEWREERAWFPSRAHAQAAYRSAPPQARRAAHALALAAAQTPADRARHLAVLGPRAEAARAALAAGKSAAAASDFASAQGWFADAARLGRGSAAKEAQLSLGVARIELSDYRGALAALAPVVAEAEPPLRARARLESARALQRSGEQERAEAHLAKLLARPSGLGPVELAEARGLYARVLVHRGEFARAVEVVSGPAGVSPALDEARGLALLYSGRLDEAEAAFQELERHAGTAPTRRARARTCAGMVAQARGDLPAAAAAHEEALALARAASDLHGQAIYAANLGAVLREQAEYARALEPTESAARDLGRLGKKLEQAGVLYNYGNLLLSLGDAAGAASAAEQALALAPKDGAPREHGYARLLGADVARCARRWGDAKAAVRAARAAFARAGARERALAALLEAEILAGAGEPDEAARALATLPKEEREAGGKLFDLARVRVQLATGRPVEPEARAALAEARRRAGVTERDFAFRADVLLACACVRDSQLAPALALIDRARATWEEIRMRTPELRRTAADEDPDAERLRRLVDATAGARSEMPGAAPHAAAPHAAGSHGAGPAEALRRLLAINKRLNSELRLPRLLELILDTVIDLTAAERGFLLLADASGTLRVEVARNIEQTSLEAGDAAFSRSIAERAAREATPIVTLDAAGDRRFEAALSVSHLKLRSVLAVPLSVKGKTVGCLYADHRLRAGAFGDADVALVCDLAEQAAIAIDNARLHEENERRRREIAELNRELEHKVESQAVELGELKKEVRSSRQALAVRYDYQNLVGRTPRMLELFRLLDRVTDTALPVVIYGESGTGKELVARALHHNGPRHGRPFVSESCAAIPETLLEAALFGHVRGAFTGADAERRGLFEVAHGGTLFLDEVGEMSPAMQGKLLRVLQSGEFRRVGGERTVHVDVRLLVASNRDLKRLVDDGRFREDLFYRLNVVRVALPPLRERQGDIPLLVEHFLSKHAGEAGGTPKRIARAALQKLVAYRWPGNVRELENEVLRAAALGGEVLSVEDLSPQVAAGEPEAAIDSPDDLAIKARVERLERTLLREALGRADGNLSQAARLLGLSRFGLQKKLARYGLHA